MAFKILLLFLSFGKLCISFLEVFELLGCVCFCLLLNFGIVFGHFLKYGFCSSLSSPSGTPIMHMLIHLMVPIVILASVHLSSLFLFMYLQTGNFQLTYLQVTHSSSCSICYCNPVVNFHYSYCSFQLYYFCLVPFRNFYISFIDIFCLLRNHSADFLQIFAYGVLLQFKQLT